MSREPHQALVPMTRFSLLDPMAVCLLPVLIDLSDQAHTTSHRDLMVLFLQMYLLLFMDLHYQPMGILACLCLGQLEESLDLDLPMDTRFSPGRAQDM